MEKRVRDLETRSAVFENRLDTAESEISMTRQDIKDLGAKLDKMSGVLMATIVLAQAIGVFFSW